MSVTDELLANHERYAASFDKGDLPLSPAKKVYEVESGTLREVDAS